MVSVKDINNTIFLVREIKEGTKMLICPLYVRLFVEHNGERKIIQFHFENHFMCDGLSVPKAFRWFMPNWDDSNDTFCIAGVVHDALYGNKGFGVLTRSECDDIFRGLLRISGYDRLHASLADFLVGAFAKSHWGDDSLNSAHKATMEMYDWFGGSK